MNRRRPDEGEGFQMVPDNEEGDGKVVPENKLASNNLAEGF